MARDALARELMVLLARNPGRSHFDVGWPEVLDLPLWLADELHEQLGEWRSAEPPDRRA